MLLELNGLTKQFWGLTAVNDFDMYVDTGEIVGLIGPNGAGKSTIFDLITGIHLATHGKINFDGKDITNKKPHQVAALGIGRTFQLNPLFTEFTVLQNVSASFHLHPKSSFLGTFFNSARYRSNEAYIQEQSMEILHLVGLEKVKDINGRGVSVLLVEQNVQMALGVAGRGYALQVGKVVMEGDIATMRSSDIVKKAYLGG